MFQSNQYQLLKSKKKEDYLILLKKDGQIIGYCGFIIRNNIAWGKLSNDNDLLSPYLFDKDLAYGMRGLIASLYIKEKYRGQNLAKQLILKRIEILRSLNIKEFISESNGNIDFHNETYKSLEVEGIIKLKNTDNQTFHHINL